MPVGEENNQVRAVPSQELLFKRRAEIGAAAARERLQAVTVLVDTLDRIVALGNCNVVVPSDLGEFGVDQFKQVVRHRGGRVDHNHDLGAVWLSPPARNDPDEIRKPT